MRSLRWTARTIGCMPRWMVGKGCLSGLASICTKNINPSPQRRRGSAEKIVREFLCGSSPRRTLTPDRLRPPRYALPKGREEARTFRRRHPRFALPPGQGNTCSGAEGSGESAARGPKAGWRLCGCCGLLFLAQIPFADIAASHQKTGVGQKHRGVSRSGTYGAEEKRNHKVRNLIDGDAHAGGLAFPPLG